MCSRIYAPEGCQSLRNKYIGKQMIEAYTSCAGADIGQDERGSRPGPALK